MEALLLSFGVIFLAELGDKSQLMALAFAARYPARTVIVSITLAMLIANGGSVLLGAVFAMALPTHLIQAAAGLAFLAFAFATFREDDGDDAVEEAPKAGRLAVVSIGTTFVLSELGDKTMLATITLATTQNPIGVWLGATAGIVAVDAIAILVGGMLGSRLPKRAIRLFAGAAFLIFGTIMLAEACGIL